MRLKEKIRNIGIGLTAIALGAIGGTSCCVRPETIADTLRMQDAYATVELCSSLDLSRESEHFRQECREASEGYERLLRELGRECRDNTCGSGYFPELR